MNGVSTGPIILSIDGNIGSGKSTLYADLQRYYSNNNRHNKKFFIHLLIVFILINNNIL